MKTDLNAIVLRNALYSIKIYPSFSVGSLPRPHKKHVLGAGRFGSGGALCAV